MATVIDTLIVSLGLDATAFTKGQKNAIDALDKLEKQAKQTSQTVKKENAEQTKAAKEAAAAQKKAAKDANDAKKKADAETKARAKQSADAFGMVKRELLSITALMLGASGIKDFIVNTVQSTSALGRMSANLAVDTQKLAQWQLANEKAGGTAEEMTSAIEAANDEIGKMQLGEGWNPALNKYKVNITEATDALDLMSRKAEGIKFAETQSLLLGKTPEAAKADARRAATEMGVGNLFNMLQGGSAATLSLVDAQEGLAKSQKNLTKESEELRQKFIQMKNDALIPFNEAILAIIPSLKTLTKAIGFISGVPAHAAKVAAGELTVFTAFGKWLGNAAGAVSEYISPSVSGTKDHSGHIQRGGGGSMPVNMRNNNPGNLIYGDFAKSFGGTAGEGASGEGAPFAKFDTIEQGTAAMQANIQGKMARGLNTITRLIEGFGGVKGWLGSGAKDLAGAPGYISDVSKRTGIDPNQILSVAQISSIQSAMMRHEGWRGALPGGATEININGPISINTKATDAQGIAKDLIGAVNNTAKNYMVAMTNTGVSQ